FSFNRMHRAVAGQYQFYLARFDFPALAMRVQRRVVSFELGILFQKLLRNIARHKEGIATAGDATANSCEFSEPHEAAGVMVHDSKIKIGGAEIFAPLAAAVFRAVANAALIVQESVTVLIVRTVV